MAQTLGRHPAHRPGGSSAITSEVPAPGLTDGFGRQATDLRISLTDRCNLRCAYCMPAEGLPCIPRTDLLGDDELIRLIRIAVRDLGIRQVRFTGGEPLLRRGLDRILEATTALRTWDGEVPETALTTNGLLLSRRARALKAAGLQRVNVSLDTLDRARYARIARRDRLHAVLDGLAAAADAGLLPVKVNAVLLRGVNDDEAVPLVRFAVEHGYQLRFIEQMPLGPQGTWDRESMMSAAEIIALLEAELTLVPTHPAARGPAPAQTWVVEGLPSPRCAVPTIGVVASVTRPFCHACDRTRLTADGQVRSCLFARAETDLRCLVRSGVDDERIAQAWRRTMSVKPWGHEIDDRTFRPPDRPMSAIGG